MQINVAFIDRFMRTLKAVAFISFKTHIKYHGFPEQSALISL